MNISIENVGLVKRAEIEINGITVVAGLNATGKTTIGKTIFATMNAYKNLRSRIIKSRMNSISKAIENTLRQHNALAENFVSYEMHDELMECITEDDIILWGKIENRNSISFRLNEWKNRNKMLVDFDIMDIYNKIIEVLDRSDDEYIKYLIDTYFNRVFKMQINCFNNNNAAKIIFSHHELSFESIFEKNKLSNNVKSVTSKNKAIYIESHNILDSYYYTRSYYRRYPQNSSIASNELFNCLIANNENEETYEEYANREEIHKIITKIINEVTHGKLKKEQGLGFHDSKNDQDVEISNISAGLKIFIVIQSLLENGALTEGDVLIIDEPEVNLHPEWQIIFAEILVMIQKELHIRIYVNSHSPYFIRAIQVKMAKYETANCGKYYLLNGENCEGEFCEDVTENIEKIYSVLYKPLEEL